MFAVDYSIGRKSSWLPSKEPVLRSSPETAQRYGLRKMPVPVCEPDLRGNEDKYVLDCVRTNWISSIGRYINQFEEEFAKWCGTEYAVACSSGTAALHLATASLALGPGDEVIVPTFTMIATPNSVAYTGATPVLVDSEPATWNIDTDAIEAKITSRTRAIMPIHTYGHPAEMDKILDLAKQYNLFVIEDAAEAHGARYKDRRVGSIGDMACFSFYGNKILTTGEGGMVTTNDPDLAAVARNLREHAFSPERHFWHKRRGFNYRMTNLQAAVGVAQMERADELVESRIRNARFYTTLLSRVPHITTPPEAAHVKNVFWMYGILVEDEFGMTRNELREWLAERGVETRTFFIPIHMQPIYHEQYHDSYPVSEELCRKGMYLPSSSMLSEKDKEYVIEMIAAAGRQARRRSSQLQCGPLGGGFNDGRHED
jgi:perosamine synthetase